MRRIVVLAAVLACAGAVAGCTPADPKDVSKFASEIIDRLKDRKYDLLYDQSSDAFKKTFTKDDFVKKMKDLEGFGQLLEVEPDGEPAVTEEDGDKIARVPYTAKFTLAEGPLSLTLRGNDVTGKWELDGYKYDVTATTFDPPYPPDQDGADKLARRFLYLWQNRRYDDLSKSMRLQEDPEKVQEFFKKLENAGQLLTMTRTRFEPSTQGGRKAAAVAYDLKFDNGTGTMNFKLLAIDGEWRIDSVNYSIEYNTK